MEPNRKQKIHVTNSSTIIHSNNKQIVKVVETCIAIKRVEKKCHQIAVGLLMRAHVNPHSTELLTFFGDGNDFNNVDAIATWVYELNPLQDSANTEDVSEYLDRYYNRLSGLGINVDEC